MAEHPTWSVGNRNPSISETITAGGVAVDLTGKTVRFKMRAVDSSTLKVDQPAVVVSAVAGTVRYDWAALDVDTAGEFLIWWEVTTAGNKQDMKEAIVLFLPHGPETHTYVEIEEFKSTAQMLGDSHADYDILRALRAASRGIDEALGRRFWPDADATQVRYYTPLRKERVYIDDLVTLTTLKTDADGDGTFENTWTANTDFVLGPLNAAADGKPYTWIDVHPRRTGSLWLPVQYPRSVQVTGKFGWAAVPPQIVTLCTIITARLLKRSREAPMGIVALGLDGATMRASQLARDPEYQYLTDGLSRKIEFA